MIELQNISKSFDGVSVLDNISAEIPDSGILQYAAHREAERRRCCA